MATSVVTKRDVLHSDEVTTSVVTKRDVIHSVAKLFDLLGLVSPVTFHDKVPLQKLWIVNASWMTHCLWSFSRNGKSYANHLQRFLI